MNTALLTPEAGALSGQPWTEYPRPLLRRASFFNLNGQWEFGASADGKARYDRKIRVPFPPEAVLSGIGEHFPQTHTLFYRKEFILPEGFVRSRVLLHFGAVNQLAKVFLNGSCIGEHSGGYEDFSFDITEQLQEANVLEVEARSELDRHVLPWGKQKEKRGGMWYTPVTGIWQTVWLESVPEVHIQDIRIRTTLSSASITVSGVSEGEILLDGARYPLKNRVAEIRIEHPQLWSPETPHLYRFAVEAGEDRIESYFALRTIETKEINGVPRLCLNGKPYFFHGLLDQGYWSDGIFTPASPDCYARDILAAKKLGFNTLRKHIKIEPQRFYYECDRLGMAVFQDMVNNGHYSFIRDTALPTIGLKRLPDKLLHRNPESRAAFRIHVGQTVRQLQNHPCILYWTIFNEGWGQFDSSSVYRNLKRLDPSRVIDSASGWFHPKDSDVESIHVYFRPYKFRPAEKPVVLSEFGGYVCRPEEHLFNPDKAYGYRFFKTQAEYQAAVEKLYRNEILPAIKKGLCAAIYTQLSDVEDETNGVLSYDRQIEKLTPEGMQALARKMQTEVKR